MNDRRRSSPFARIVPAIVVAVAGLTLGLLLANRDRAPADEAADAAGATETVAGAAVASPAGNTRAGSEDAQLEALQGKLARTQMLPSDFRTVPAFTLIGSDGEPLDGSFLDGRWSLAFFGYTNCPDVCPVTLSVMKDVVTKLEDSGTEPMQVVFVTVDPVRDTAERMREYISFFDEDFVGVTGELADIQALTRELGIVASFTADEKTPGGYIVDHTASMLLIDPERRVRAKFSAPHELDTIVADYTAIRAALN